MPKETTATLNPKCRLSPITPTPRRGYWRPEAERRLLEAEDRLREAEDELHRRQRTAACGDSPPCDHADDSCVANAIGNLCQSFLLSYGVRVGIGFLLRGFKLARGMSYSSLLVLKCPYNYAKSKNKFHLWGSHWRHGDSLLFPLACAQIMYAFVMRPESLPKSYKDFIQKTGPVAAPTQILVLRTMPSRISYIQENIPPILLFDFCAICGSGPTKGAVQSTSFLSAFVGIFQAVICMHRKIALTDHKLVVLFCACMGGIMYYLEHEPDTTARFLRGILNLQMPKETTATLNPKCRLSPITPTPRRGYWRPEAERRLLEAEDRLREAEDELHRRQRTAACGDSPPCDHADDSCVANAIGNLCQSFLLSYGVRVGIGFLLRGFKLARGMSYSSLLVLKCPYNYAKSKNKFHLWGSHWRHGNSLLFPLACAQIMYAFVMRPESLPKSYKDFIQKTGPVAAPTQILVLRTMPSRISYIQENIPPILLFDFCAICGSGPTKGAVQSTSFLSAFVGIFQAVICMHRKIALTDHKLVVLFCACMGGIMYYLEHEPDTTARFLRGILNLQMPKETTATLNPKCRLSPITPTPRRGYWRPEAERRLLEAEDRLREAEDELHRRQRTAACGDSPPCDHADDSCVANAIGNLCQSFLLSYGVRVGIGFLLRGFKLARGMSYSSLLVLKVRVLFKSIS
ncbi:putative Ankyrin repeat family protein [Hibiscus syriacus]|uniref:Ankyrin repeat family protein n=1 Tax=Hibiscus syriacus TaxID=106335 RepID=A0A6A2YE43_HIBSY|nr:putative Ankyrin repeat family protein [Hibiscus syriacus]